MKSSFPLISCICITKDRPLFLQRAIACFNRQDYPNKELVVSYPVSDLATQKMLNQTEDQSGTRIVRLERPEQETLGTSRNNAVLAAKGSYVCFWDDDDWHSSNRISQQFMVLKDGPFKASILMNVRIHDEENKETYDSLCRYFHGTLLVERAILTQVNCSDSDIGEIDQIIPYLLSKNVLFHILDQPALYLFIYHGNNTSKAVRFHHDLLQSKQIDRGLNQQILEMIHL